MNCMAANTAHSAEIPQNRRNCKLEPWLLSDRAIFIYTDTHAAVSAGHNPGPVDDFLHQGGRAL